MSCAVKLLATVFLRKFLEYRFGGILVDFIMEGDDSFLVSSGLAVYVVVTAMTDENCPLPVEFLEQLSFLHARTNFLLWYLARFRH